MRFPAYIAPLAILSSPSSARQPISITTSRSSLSGHTVGVGGKRLALGFQSTLSAVYREDGCPLFVSCFTDSELEPTYMYIEQIWPKGVGRVMEALCRSVESFAFTADHGELGQTRFAKWRKEPELSVTPEIPRLRDVAGIIGFGPRSDIGQQFDVVISRAKAAQESLDLDIQLVANESNHVGYINPEVPRYPFSSGWYLNANVSVGNATLSLSRVALDLTSVDTVVPDRVLAQFGSELAATFLPSLGRSRMYVNCSAGVVSWTIHFENADFPLIHDLERTPVEDRVLEDDLELCPLPIVRTGDMGIITIGMALFNHFERVVLQGRAQTVVFVPFSSRSVPPPFLVPTFPPAKAHVPLFTVHGPHISNESISYILDPNSDPRSDQSYFIPTMVPLCIGREWIGFALYRFDGRFDPGSVMDGPPGMRTNIPRMELLANGSYSLSASRSVGPISGDEESYYFLSDEEFDGTRYLVWNPATRAGIVYHDFPPSANADANTCPVCLDSMAGQRAARLHSCGHSFHPACVEEWAAVKNTCPLCRTQVRPSE